MFGQGWSKIGQIYLGWSRFVQIWPGRSKYGQAAPSLSKVVPSFTRFAQLRQGGFKLLRVCPSLLRLGQVYSGFSRLSQVYHVLPVQARLVQVETCWARFVRIGASSAKLGKLLDSLTKGLANKRLWCVSVCFSYCIFFKLVHVCRNKDGFGQDGPFKKKLLKVVPNIRIVV